MSWCRFGVAISALCPGRSRQEWIIFNKADSALLRKELGLYSARQVRAFAVQRLRRDLLTQLDWARARAEGRAKEAEKT